MSAVTGPAERLAELGLVLPEPPKPVASYVPAVRTGDLLFTSSQLPFVDGELPAVGLVAEGSDRPERYVPMTNTDAVESDYAVDSREQLRIHRQDVLHWDITTWLENFFSVFVDEKNGRLHI